MSENLTWRRGVGHSFGPFNIRVVTATIDGKGPMYTLSRVVQHGSRIETMRITFDGTPNKYDAENTSMRDLRKAKKAVETLAKAEGLI